jgi:hypothetical protein
MGKSALEELSRMAGIHYRKARWMWQSVAGSEADAIHAEQGVGRDMAAVVLEDTPPDPDLAAQALLDEVGETLATVVRNRLHRFRTTAVAADQPTASRSRVASCSSREASSVCANAIATRLPS